MNGKLIKKNFTITLNNAKYNDRVTRLLQNYFLFNGSSICGSEFLHVRCGAHVLNLIVKARLHVIDEAVYKIRENVKYVKGYKSRVIKFAELVKQLSLETNKKLRQDIVTRWNSTYLMLERALLFRHAFSRLQDVDDDYKLRPLEEEWQRVEKIAEFFRPFYDMTLLFSGSKYPTTNLYFPNVWKIQCLLNKEANSPDFLISEMASNMKTKFQKYWDCYSVILSFAIILDPRYKLQFVEYCFFVLDPQSRDEMVLSIKQKLFICSKSTLRPILQLLLHQWRVLLMVMMDKLEISWMVLMCTNLNKGQVVTNLSWSCILRSD
ncbi:zinc finger BED domain-containing protein RICESLEEPER 2-like [Coffea eugenioides]|uniref:zinc finger BED domain-containing protein RICESLEEPER 2-like n=1 Tax=Coffea eugenioides TaxID=49369 RepID=UPI000F614DEE|nr:zinc finger BED domain-containing protein RICESLEEPER 2-like [Coffea eugenioides]XP_027176345.1 zinc finger BED domain-containing protein RICESLEEPER 2-like [Coffea eugenioides]XP_027176346.1 zinc finger BED domain-containing protein RICESLEEPER 2-like [Coffea eugenioides]XP_027176347.1 zinc finger BED domain-containing protein RICESLEEPER 2-like [Coffea eugenioides]XP_027176348.1 zinc finger BED domain-containing protein RICESLEEPER 2-like [Coffea eugenioides]